jgi:hypothetical protein
MPYTMTPGAGLAGPVKQKTPIDALAEFLGVDSTEVPAMSGTVSGAGSPSLELAQLRGGRADELATNVASGAASPGSDRLLSMLRGEMDSDPDTGVAAQKQAAANTEASYQQYGDLPRQQRQEALDAKLAVGRIPGETARDVAHINASGDIAKQALANEGSAYVAETNAGAKGGGGSRLPSGLMERIAGAHTALNTLDELEQLYPKVQGFVNGMGPVAGRMSEFMQGVPGMPSNPDFNGFTARSSTLANAVIKAITGAQMSEPEAVRIMKQIPTVHDRSDVWKSKTTAMRSNLASTVQNIQNENQSGQGGPGLSRDRLMQIAASLGLSVGGDSGDDPYANPDYQPQ